MYSALPAGGISGGAALVRLVAVTVFSTVGFRDITPMTDVVRVIVAPQLLLDLVLLGALVRLVVGTAKIRIARGKQPDRRSR